jgi:hypothetical protein
VDDFQEVNKATQDSKLLNNIVKAYEQILGDKVLESQNVLKNEQEIARKENEVKKNSER